MAEDYPKIGVSLDQASLAELKAFKKQLEVLFAPLRPGDPLYEKTRQGLVEVKNQISSVATAVASDEGIKQKAYFETGRVLRSVAIETNGLTEFIKKQRMENRLQNFVLNESRQAVMAMSVAVTGLTGSTGALNGAITQGIGAFQGFDFAIASVGSTIGKSLGVWGLIIAAAGALTVAIVEFFSKQSEAAKKAKEDLASYDMELAKIMYKRSGEFVAYATALSGETGRKKMAWMTYEGGDPVEKKRLELEYQKALQDELEAWKQIGKEIKDQNKEHEKTIQHVEKIYSALPKYKGMTSQYGSRFKGQKVKTVGATSGMGAARGGGGIAESTNELMQQSMMLDVLSQGWQDLGGVIQVSFIDKMRQSTNDFERFVGGVLSGIEQIANKLISSAISSLLLSFLFPSMGGFGAVFGGMTGIPMGSAGRKMPGGQSFSPSFGMGGMTNIQIVETKVKGRDLMQVWKVERSYERKRGGNI